MNEERLFEIASTISVLNGQLVILGYLSSLRESDMYLFLKYVKSSKYGDKGFYDAVKLFSRDYLESKGLTSSNDGALEFGYKEGNYDDYFLKSGFTMEQIDNYMAMNDIVNVSKNRN